MFALFKTEVAREFGRHILSHAAETLSFVVLVAGQFVHHTKCMCNTSSFILYSILHRWKKTCFIVGVRGGECIKTTGYLTLINAIHQYIHP